MSALFQGDENAAALLVFESNTHFDPRHQSNDGDNADTVVEVKDCLVKWKADILTVATNHGMELLDDGLYMEEDDHNDDDDDDDECDMVNDPGCLMVDSTSRDE